MKIVFIFFIVIIISACKEPEQWESLGNWGFSPNADGINDYFILATQNTITKENQILFDTTRTNLMTIYEARSGSLVFESTEYHQNWWNGKHFKTLQQVPVGSYKFFLEIEDSKTYYGFVFVLY